MQWVVLGPHKFRVTVSTLILDYCLSMLSFACCPHTSKFSGFLPLLRNKSGGLAMLKLPLGVNECVKCAWFLIMERIPASVTVLLEYVLDPLQQ